MVEGKFLLRVLVHEISEKDALPSDSKITKSFFTSKVRDVNYKEENKDKYLGNVLTVHGEEKPKF